MSDEISIAVQSPGALGGAWRAMVPQPGGGRIEARSLALSGPYPLAGTTDGAWWYGVAP